MSYDIALSDPDTGETIKLDRKHQWKGGTYCMGGSELAELNITYNYSEILERVLGEAGIRALYGKTGSQSLEMLTAALKKLAEEPPDNDYWKATDGNVRMALIAVLDLATMCPDGIWGGD